MCPIHCMYDILIEEFKITDDNQSMTNEITLRFLDNFQLSTLFIYIAQISTESFQMRIDPLTVSTSNL